MNFFPEEKRQKRSEKIMHKIKTLGEVNNLVVKTNWIPLAHCVQRNWLLKFYVKLSRKDTTDEFHIHRNTSLNG